MVLKYLRATCGVWCDQQLHPAVQTVRETHNSPPHLHALRKTSLCCCFAPKCACLWCEFSSSVQSSPGGDSCWFPTFLQMLRSQQTLEWFQGSFWLWNSWNIIEFSEENTHKVLGESDLKWNPDIELYMIWPPVSCLLSSTRQHHLQVRAGPTRRSTPTSRSWRSLSPACRPSPPAPLSTSWATGRPTKTWAAGISTTTAPPESGPGSPRAPGTPAAAPAVSEGTARAQWRVRWGVLKMVLRLCDFCLKTSNWAAWTKHTQNWKYLVCMLGKGGHKQS